MKYQLIVTFDLPDSIDVELLESDLLAEVEACLDQAVGVQSIEIDGELVAVKG